MLRYIACNSIKIDLIRVTKVIIWCFLKQGKILPTPERVPFRLTRDIVDGFGPCGVEGTFRRSCEVTLGVLMRHKDVVMTLLEVLMFDPLFSWSLTPSKVNELPRQPFCSRGTKKKLSSSYEELQAVLNFGFRPTSCSTDMHPRPKRLKSCSRIATYRKTTPWLRELYSEWARNSMGWKKIALSL